MAYIVDTSTNTVYLNNVPVQSGSGATGPTGPSGSLGPTGPTGPTPDTSVFLTQSSASSTYTTISEGSANYLTIKSPNEVANVVAAGATGTINVDVATSTVWYYTSNASANFTLNFRYDSGTSLSSKLPVGKSMTVVFMNTNGATAYYPNVIQIDSATVSPLIQGGTAITSGNVSAIDAYSFTIIKTDATPTYKVFESQTQFK